MMISRIGQQHKLISPSLDLQPLEIVADLEQESDVRRLFDESSRHFDGRLDLLVNNAGIGIPVDHTQVEECWQSFRRTMQVNLMAAAQLTLLAAPLLKSTAEKLRQRDSDADSLTCTTCIINIGSIAALRPTQTLAAYGTSKMALNMYSQCMACELAPLIRVNCINPGPIATKLVERAGFDLNQFKQICAQANPLNRIGRADEVAQAVLYLADWSKSGYITGAQLSIDGGCVLSPVRWNLQ